MKYWELLIGFILSSLIVFFVYTGVKQGRPDLVLAVLPALIVFVIVFGLLDEFFE